eukprot:CAMPEP_0169065818 /NCGR_PEP_ID=MMETSP1015-20121227/2608_1 /TAXON_ID=342587 /ORGANISM="Karlodinium micrum, Strain CCMP2283" /LENGTH=556 /DNA_ID=CAMNT_0009124421 /DNA_START=62 /DNA_END=1729 /DNA_ORIENTATION=-
MTSEMQDEDKEEKDEVSVSDEVWAKRAAARQRQIDIGKARHEYECFINTVPNGQRVANHPRTPDPHAKVSKRAFDRLLSTWRRQLHDFDIGDKGIDTGVMACTPGTDSTRADSEAGVSPPSADGSFMSNPASWESRVGSQFFGGERQEVEDARRRLQLAPLLSVGQPYGGPPRRGMGSSSCTSSSPLAPNATAPMLSSLAMMPPQQFARPPTINFQQFPATNRPPLFNPAMNSFVPAWPAHPATWAQPQQQYQPIPASHGNVLHHSNTANTLNTCRSSSSSSSICVAVSDTRQQDLQTSHKESHAESESAQNLRGASNDRAQSPQSPKVRKAGDAKDPSTPPLKTTARAFSSPDHRVQHANRSPSSPYGSTFNSTPSPQQAYARQRAMNASVAQQQVQSNTPQVVQTSPFPQGSYQMQLPSCQVGTPATPVNRVIGFQYGPGSGSVGSIQPQCGSAVGSTQAMYSPFVFPFERPNPLIVSPVAPPLPFNSPPPQRQYGGFGLTPGPKPQNHGAQGLTPGPGVRQPTIESTSRDAVDHTDLASYTANCAQRFEMAEW